MDVLDEERWPLVVLRSGGVWWWWALGLRGGCRALNRSLIRLIHSALVYKRTSSQSAQFNSAPVPVGLLHPRVFLFPEAVEENKSAGKRREGREPRGSCEACATAVQLQAPCQGCVSPSSLFYREPQAQLCSLQAWRSRFRFLSRQLAIPLTFVTWTTTQIGKFRAQQPPNEPYTLPRS